MPRLLYMLRNIYFGEIMSNTEDISLAAQLTRIRAILGLRDEAALAEFLGVSLADMDAARERGKLPAEWLLILLLARNISPEWVLTGVGPCYLAAPALCGRYLTAAEAAGAGEADTADTQNALRRIPSRLLAEELLRRLAVAEAAALSCHPE